MTPHLPLSLPGLPAQDTCEAAAEVLRDTGYRVLRPLVRPPVATEESAELSQDRAQVLLVNTQTTGLDPEHDQLLELAVLPIEYDRVSGCITDYGPTIVQRHDPHRELYPDEVRRSGLTTADLVGRCIDERFLDHIAKNVDGVIAFHAAFHQRFVFHPAPILAGSIPWACAWKDVPWSNVGRYRYQSLPALLATHARMYLPESSHAEQYVEAIAALLGTPFRDGSLPLWHLMTRLRERFYHLHVVFSGKTPVSMKYELKARGYRYHPGNAEVARGWWTVLPEREAHLEREWVTDHLYAGALWPRQSRFVKVALAERLNPYGLKFGI